MKSPHTLALLGKPCLAACLLMPLASASVAAQESGSPLFPTGPSVLARNRLFMRVGYLQVFIKTKSGNVEDVTGPVITRADVAAGASYGDALPSTDPLSRAHFDIDDFLSYTIAAAALGPAIDAEIAARGGTGLGSPAGISVKARNTSTLGLSVGYWLTDDYTWTVEAYIAALPLSVKVEGAGLNPSGRPNGLSGKEIVSSKVLPPLVQVGRYFGDKDSTLRPYLGLGGMYAFFFDAKAEQALTSYAGGKTTVSVKNAWGVGPFVGLKAQLSEDWHLHVSAGQIQIKTEAKLITHNTTIRSGAAILNDYNPGVAAAADFGTKQIDSNFTTKLLQVVAQSKGQADLGTYERKLNTTLTNTIVSIGIGRSF